MKSLVTIMAVSAFAFADAQPQQSITHTYYLEALEAKPLFNNTEAPQKEPIAISEEKVSPEPQKEPERKQYVERYDSSNIQYKPSSTGWGGMINRAMGVKVPNETGVKKSAVGQRGIDDYIHNFLGVPRP